MDTVETRPEQKIRAGEYKKLIERIKELKWETLDAKDLQRLMYLSCASAREFAEALRIAVKLFPNDQNLMKTAEGELQTDNLILDDYAQKGDHADFLEHFLRKYNLVEDEQLAHAAKQYSELCRQLPDEIRAMSIFSREEELSGIFQRILEATDWTAPGLAEFKFYLESHIRIDTEIGGHHDLTKELPVDDRVKAFYEARLDMYTAIPRLFETEE